MKRFLVILAVLALGACAGTPDVRATNALAVACDTYATLSDQVNPLIAQRKLSTDSVKRISAADNVVKPVCGSDSIVDPATAINVVLQGVDLLRAVKSTF